MACEFGKRVVLDDPAARKVLAARFGLAPSGECLQPAQHLNIAARQLEALPRILGREGEAGRVGEALHFLVEPEAAAIAAQFFDHSRKDGRQMSDVADRIIDLALVERATAPVGKARALVERMAEHRFDQARIADLFSEPQSHRGDLRIEQRVGDLVGHVVDDLEILAPGVEDLEHVVVVDEQVPQRLKIETARLGIDRCRLVGRGDLEEAELRPIAVLAHELGIDGDEVVGGEALDQCGKARTVGDQGMNVHVVAGLSPSGAG